ncbi:hypothetical protein [Mycoplasma procyoni]|uniref:hypothetical protein n=1 Tax=Mycoplasma procyoni TaxID=568784 RepID=UPI00197B618C|nr:hypothetical protein [Mycoplasma procyoni]MBN3535017.1 hypothetical protein [Mycoplasma procyoni]
MENRTKQQRELKNYSIVILSLLASKFVIGLAVFITFVVAIFQIIGDQITETNQQISLEKINIAGLIKSSIAILFFLVIFVSLSIANIVLIVINLFKMSNFKKDSKEARGIFFVWIAAVVFSALEGLMVFANIFAFGYILAGFIITIVVSIKTISWVNKEIKNPIQQINITSNFNKNPFDESGWL